jgi:hypothetical protein
MCVLLIDKLSEQGFAYLGLLVYYDLVKTVPSDERFDVSSTGLQLF